MRKQITAIIVGAGHRAILYSLYALEHPDELKIVGVADPDPIRRKKVAEMHGFGEEMCFRSAEELAERPKLADAVINEPWTASMCPLRFRSCVQDMICCWKSPSRSARRK